MSYSLNPGDDEGKLRLLTFDVSNSAAPVYFTDYFFQDNELTAILDLNGDDLWDSAADICRAKAARLTEKAIKLGLGKSDILLDRTRRPSFYIALARDYQSRSGSNVAEFMDSVNVEVDNIGRDVSEYVGDL